MGFLYRFWSYAVYVFWYILPPTLRPEGFLAQTRLAAEQGTRGVRLQQLARVLRVLLHILFLVLMVWLLWQLNRSYDLERVLRSPWRFLHRFWLPGLFLLLYAMFWLGWWVLKLLGQEAETESFPDIEAAWGEAQKALARAGLEATEVPLFLVLGRPRRDVDDLFAGAELSFQVRHEPADRDAPLHVYGGPSGIFVTCEGASLLGQASYLLGHDPGEEANLQPRELAASLTDPGETPTNGTGRGGHTADATERAEAPARTALLLEEDEAPAQPAPRRRLLMLDNADEAERRLARLKFLCRLIARRRQPYCPVNGILVVLPVAATDSGYEATQTGALCHQDLTVARQALQVHCPVQVLVCDLETVPGFAELLRRLPEEKQRQQLLGRRYPLLPRLADPELPGMLDGGVKWLCQEMLASVAFRLLELDGEAADTQAVVAGNARLVRFLGEWDRRQANLSRILVQALTPEPGEPMLLGGCYLGATGPDAQRQRAFVPGVFRLLIESQNYVFWTRQASHDEAHYRRLTYLTTAAAVLMLLTALALAVFVWYGP